MKFEIGVQNTLMSALMLALGAAAAVALGCLRGRRAGLSSRRLVVAAVLAPVLAAACSHIGYLLVTLPEVFYGWRPGQLFYGGLLGAVLALCAAGGSGRVRLMDAFAPALALMLFFARLAEGYAGQGYGEYWYGENCLLCRFPFMTYDPYYESWGWALFMAEAAVAALIMIALLRGKNAFPGDRTLLLFGLYASAQVVLESLRRDEFLRWGFVRVEELLSAVVILAVLVLYWLRTGRRQIVKKAVITAVFAAMVVFCLLLEFATEGRVSFLVFLDVWHCYALMALACAVNAACVLCMRRTAIPDKER